MPIRTSVVEIPVDDTKFRRFTELFQQYQEKLAKTPGVWQQVPADQRCAPRAAPGHEGVHEPGEARAHRAALAQHRGSLEVDTRQRAHDQP